MSPVTFSVPPPADTQLRRARAAVGALFLINGAVYANLIPRFPEIKAELALTNTHYGLAIAAFPSAALLAGLASGALNRRFGSARVAVASSLVLCAGVAAAAVAGTWQLLVAALVLAGGADAVTDVAQNAHGLRVQELYRRSILNSLHGLWSVGALLGGLMSAAATAAGIDRGLHLAVTSIGFALLAMSASAYLLPGGDQPPSPTPGTAATEPVRRSSTRLLLAALVLLTVAGCVVEDAGSSWAALYLRGLGAGEATAAFGFVAMVGCQCVGRLLGDRVVDRFGQRAVATAGGVLIAVTMGTALLVPSTVTVILGFGAAGLGTATVVPAAFSAASQAPESRPGANLTIVTSLMRVGFLSAPPAVGVVADLTSLRVGLIAVPLAGLLIVGCAGVLSSARRVRTRDARVST